ncbi:hypothetical protein L1987_21676 [Smallanthus sonchifolius]|uniref:Uncharacterized protein n=1 Tax=Smallanthus sonchifolius TaxID=185202 RepID=A0ACB9IEH5_9ASTR|nr:hypothetical protein L1987_21676 [Smallanthus sonchifolius]
MKIRLLHVHQSAQSIKLLDDKFSMHKVHAGKVWIDANNVVTGIGQAIELHGVQWLVIGDASAKLYAKRNGSTLPSPHESQDKLVQSRSVMFLEGPQRLSSSGLQDRLWYATKDVKKSKHKAFEESIKQWKAEEDANEALNTTGTFKELTPCDPDGGPGKLSYTHLSHCYFSWYSKIGRLLTCSTWISRWILKCHACFKVTIEIGRIFCPSCGNGGTLRKVAVTKTWSCTHDAGSSCSFHSLSHKEEEIINRDGYNDFATFYMQVKKKCSLPNGTGAFASLKSPTLTTKINRYLKFSTGASFRGNISGRHPSNFPPNDIGKDPEHH